ncbi:hypothetical protein PHMEG_00022647 [Phytophthora megakarya]|uniref:OTU domain-containing protein n=1 Tax=Phytophthora megakarya TaxID=4795 RepID=A0A225VL81_9STRA|nr:hypothetical protein PHMEG_00022647 [Phytophthora megakarya]
MDISGSIGLSGYDVFKHCDLNPVQTPATGNCQFYGVAMAMLNKHFDSPANITAIENVTAKLKKGMNMAAQYGFEVEFPHDIRKVILRSHVKNAGELTIKESADQLKEHLEDMSTTSSKSTTFISRALWGSEVTLLLMAKLLEQPIYVVVAPRGLEHASYQIFKPIKKVTAAHELQSAGEDNYTCDKAQEWVKTLQQECNECSISGKLPIVLYYGSQHYTWLKLEGESRYDQLKSFVSTEVQIMANDSDGDAKMPLVEECPHENTAKAETVIANILQEDLEDSVLTERERDELLEVLQHGKNRQQKPHMFPDKALLDLATGLQNFS